MTGKHQFLPVVSLILLAAGALSAQTTPHIKVKFAFEVDGTRMPAGSYSVEVAEGGTPIVLKAEGAGRTIVIKSVTVDLYATPCGCVRFHRYADGLYVLSDIELGPQTPALELVSARRKSREEYPMMAVQVAAHAE